MFPKIAYDNKVSQYSTVFAAALVLRFGEEEIVLGFNFTPELAFPPFSLFVAGERIQREMFNFVSEELANVGGELES